MLTREYRSTGARPDDRGAGLRPDCGAVGARTSDAPTVWPPGVREVVAVVACGDRVRRLLGRVLCLAAALGLLACGVARAQMPWPGGGTQQLPPDPTVPYLPAVPPLICPGGEPVCLDELASDLTSRTDALGCDHDAIFSDAYLTITRALAHATASGGPFERPDRIRHEARTYAQEYFRQFDAWHAGDRSRAAPAWRVALWAAEREAVTSVGDLMLALNAHIRRDNPIRAVEQTEGVLRVDGPMPAASGRPDHDHVNEVLANAMHDMLDHLAERYDETIDDGAVLFGTALDPRGLFSIIAAWREESWRNAEELRHARAAGGVDGPLYRAKLAAIEASAKAGADAILAATLTDPMRNAARNAYCQAHA
jgi:hypothetical protein